MASQQSRDWLQADCERCFALCCVVPALGAGADFAIDKPSGQPCPNLGAGFRCRIHDRLRERGFAGCVGYDCFGAGQRVARETFAGRDWQESPPPAGAMFKAFSVMVRLHELLWYLRAALARPEALPIRAEIERAYDRTAALAASGSDRIVAVDADAHLGATAAVLRRVSALVRAAARGNGQHPGQPRPEGHDDGGRGPDLRHADLIGGNLRGADLRGADLSGALLIGADLSETDLTGADLLGADLRAANLGGANLTSALFLTRTQIQGATGDRKTALPPGLARPQHWMEPSNRHP